MTLAIEKQPIRATPQDLMAITLGAKRQNYIRSLSPSNVALAAESIQGSLFPLYKGEVVNNIFMQVSVAAATPSNLSKWIVLIYSLSGVLLDQSTDQSSAFQTIGVKKVAMPGANKAKADGCVYFVAYADQSASGGIPSVLAGNAIGGSSGTLDGGSLENVVQTSVGTAPPSPATLAVSSRSIWFAYS